MMNPSLGIFLINTNRLIKETTEQIDEDLKVTIAKLSYNMGAGLVSNTLGSLGGFSSLLSKSSGDINTSSNNINDSTNSLDKSVEEINKMKQESEITVKVKNYDAQSIEKNKNISEYFVVLPQYKNFTIPGSNKHKGNKTQFQVEDLAKAPSSDYYFPVGYIPKPKSKEEKSFEGIKVEDEGKISNISKHYRRYFKTSLEESRELHIKSPFYTVYLRRNKDKDSKDETAIFTALSEKNNKLFLQLYLKKIIKLLNHMTQKMTIRHMKKKKKLKKRN